MKTFKRYLSSLNKGSIVEVLDLPAADLDRFLATFFFIDIGKRMATIMNLILSWICSEVYRGSFPKAGLFPVFFHHLKANCWHQNSTAVNINRFSCCNSSQIKHLQGPSDLNSQVVFFRCGHSQHLWAPVQISNGPVTIMQEPQKRRRVFIESDDEMYSWFRLNCIFFHRHGRTAFEQVWSTFL